MEGYLRTTTGRADKHRRGARARVMSALLKMAKKLQMQSTLHVSAKDYRTREALICA